MSPTPLSTLAVYKGKAFARFAKKADISDTDLWKAIQRADEGLIDADLGGGVIKQRIAREGQGKSSGSRTIILFRAGQRAMFISGFEKKDMANIDDRDLEGYRDFARDLFKYSDAKIATLLLSGALLRVEPEKENA